MSEDSKPTTINPFKKWTHCHDCLKIYIYFPLKGTEKAPSCTYAPDAFRPSHNLIDGLGREVFQVLLLLALQVQRTPSSCTLESFVVPPHGPPKKPDNPHKNSERGVCVFFFQLLLHFFLSSHLRLFITSTPTGSPQTKPRHWRRTTAVPARSLVGGPHVPGPEGTGGPDRPSCPPSRGTRRSDSSARPDSQRRRTASRSTGRVVRSGGEWSGGSTVGGSTGPGGVLHSPTEW